MKNDYGVVTLGGLTVRLTSDPECVNNGTDGGVRYQASAVGEDGQEYTVLWDTVDGWEDHVWGEDGCVVEDCHGWCSDGANACDWDRPAEIVKK